MSLESALDEERKAVMALLEGRTAAPKPSITSARAASPAGAISPVRSMLDVGPTPMVRHSIAASSGVGPPSPRQGAIRSMLDTSSPPLSPLNPARSAASPPPAARMRVDLSPLRNPEDSYNFTMLPSIEHHAMPKRVTQGGKKQKSPAPGISGGDARGAPRHASTAGILGRSMSPSRPVRSPSPGLNTNSVNLMPSPGKYVTDSGKVIDMSSAYRRLSDAAILRSGSSSLSGLAKRKGSDPVKGESQAPDGSARLEKDYYESEEEEAVESSDESDGSEDEGWGSKRRGRARTRSKDYNDIDKIGERMRKPKSLLAAAEDERKKISSSYKVQSLLEPTVTVTGPDGEKTTAKRSGVHPITSFDQGASGVSTPVTSDTEADISDIKRAQRLELRVSPIQSHREAHRCLRTIVRGEYERFQQEALEGLRRQRVYLVATDLSEEAAYALEWTIGTVLRDGDTLIAVYAVDEELGTGEGVNSVNVGEGAKAMREATSAIVSLQLESKNLENNHSPGPSHLRTSLSAAEIESQPNFSAMDRAAKERYSAAEEVSQRCIKLLRKTKLQVRVVVEIFHCKSPKHMLIEVIDFLEPTLVILGSRGRSALKGVLLGSFSNYLVTKSSVPVMVARKRLRKHSKYKRTNLRLSNVLNNPNKLAMAKID